MRDSWKLTAAAGLAIGICGVPLAIAPGLVLEYETTPKLLVLLCAAAVLLACHRGWWFGLSHLLHTRHGRLFGCVLALQAASLAWGTLFSAHPALSLAGSAWRRYGLVTQCALLLFSLTGAAAIARWPEVLRRILQMLAVCAGAIALYAAAQYAGFDPFLSGALYNTFDNGGILRVPGTLGHAVYLGSYLAACIPVAAGLGAASVTLRGKLFWGGLAGIALLSAVLCGSRSALVGLAAGALISLPALRRIKWRGNLAVVAVPAAALLLVLTVALTPDSTFRLRLKQWSDDAWGGPRLMVWRESIALAVSHPLDGSGPEVFTDEFRRRQSAVLSRAYPEFIQESPHNLLLDGSIAQGISFVPVVCGIVFLMCSDYRRQRGPALWLRASLASTLVSLQFVTPTISGGLMLYGVLGMFVACRVTGKGDAAEAASRVPVGWAACCYGLALVSLAAGFAYVRKDMAYANLVEAAAKGRFGDMVEAYRTASAGWFPASGDDLWVSRQFAAIARKSDPATAARAWALAAEAAGRAESTGGEQAEAAYQCALLAIGVNQASQAEIKLRQALEYAPTWHRPHLLLAQLLHYTGREAESKQEAARALDLSGPVRATVEQTLRTLEMP